MQSVMLALAVSAVLIAGANGAGYAAHITLTRHYQVFVDMSSHSWPGKRVRRVCIVLVAFAVASSFTRLPPAASPRQTHFTRHSVEVYVQ